MLNHRAELYVASHCAVLQSVKCYLGSEWGGSVFKSERWSIKSQGRCLKAVARKVNKEARIPPRREVRKL